MAKEFTFTVDENNEEVLNKLAEQTDLSKYVVSLVEESIKASKIIQNFLDGANEKEKEQMLEMLKKNGVVM